MTYQLIRTIESLNNIRELLLSAKVIGVDTETTGLDPYIHDLRLIQLAVDETVYIIDCFAFEIKGNPILNQVFSGNQVKVFQNAKFDIKFLMANEFSVGGKIFDTMLAGQLLRSAGHTPNIGLKGLCHHYLDVVISKEEQTSDFSKELSQSQLEYAAKDAYILLELREKMIHEIKRNKLVEVARLEFACVLAIAHIEYMGIHLSLKDWQALTLKNEKEEERILEDLYPYIGYPTIQLGLFESVSQSDVNLNSNQQMLELLKKEGIEVDNVSKHALNNYIKHPLVHALLEYRKVNKALTSFLYGFPKLIHPMTHRLHPKYGQIGAYSGRMSCGHPNIQQIPRETEFRSCFSAPEGRKLIIADYSQIELRVMAQVSRDKRMIDAYKNGEDLHRLTASLVQNKPIEAITKDERQAAKAVNFGLIFGMGAAGLKAYAKESYGSDMTLKEAEIFRTRFFDSYIGVNQWQNHIKRYKPKEARTLSGRLFRFGPNSGLSVRFNAPIQGTAADILKHALGNLYKYINGTSIKLVALVHDEIVLECDTNQTEIVKNKLIDIMEFAGARYLKDLPVVAEASISDTWAGK